MPSPRDVLRKLPSVDRALARLEEAGALDGAPRGVAVACVREAVEAERRRILEGDPKALPDDLEAAVVAAARRRLAETLAPHYRKVINATGIILHTALGRAVLAERARRRIADELDGYSLLQADPATGRRSRRDARIEALLQRVTGCQAATVVNNNAAATMIVLSAVARGREVIVSRGQLVEIGGSFRLPEVMRESGATLVEVGTTNKTHPRDYENAVTDRTAAILRVHPSNYKVHGFTSETPLETLERIAHARGLVLIDDLGAGPLVDLSKYGFPSEPTVQESVAAGADLVTSSADKLVGAAQGGLVLGRRAWIETVRTHPLARIVRVGKLTLAALEATLTLFLDEATALAQVPTLRMLTLALEDVATRADSLAAALKDRAGGALEVEVTGGFSQLGSGSLPTHDIPTRLVALVPKDRSPDDLAARLRLGRPSVFARIREGRLLVDPRTLQPGEDEPLLAAVARALAPDEQEAPRGA